MSSRLLLAIAALVLVGLGVMLAIQSRAPAPQTDVVVPKSPPVAVAPTPPSAPTPSQPAAAPPPARTPDAARAPAGEKLARGELPFPPPVFADERDRDRFKRWWVAEMVRRADVYKRMEPDRRYPPDQDVERMMDRLYDLSEPPPANADQAAMARVADKQLQYFELANKTFVGAFGVPATEIVRRGGDPKWGQASDPPVLPPNWQGP